MDFTKTVSLIVVGYVLDGAVARAQDLCPAGPFETSVRAIAAAIASQPLRPRVWDATVEFTSPPPQLTDGVYWNSLGGFMSPYGRSLSYDAKRYVLVGVFGEWPSREAHPTPGHGEALANQVVRRVRNATYTTTITRPTPEQARRYACLANSLVASSPKGRSSSTERAAATSETMAKSAVSGKPNETCSPTGASTDAFDPDSHEGRFELRSGGLVVDYNTELSCTAREALLYRMNQLTEDWLDESIARAKGTWRAPRVAALATDAANDLYLLLDLGTLRHSFTDILKLTPSGDMTRLPVPMAGPWEAYADTFTVDEQGHAWVPMPSSAPPIAWVFDIGPDGDPDYVGAGRPRGVPEPTKVDRHVDSIATDASHRYLYAMSGSEILQIATDGTATPFVDISRWTRWRWFSRPPSHLAAASDGTLFVSDPSGNTIIKVTREKVVTFLAGAPGKAGAADGAAGSARFNSPKGLALDREGTVYVADSGNQTIRRITSDGQVSTFVGEPGKRGTVDGQGEVVRLDRPTWIAVDNTGTLYVTNGEDNLIRRISPAGIVGTLDARPFVDPP